MTYSELLSTISLPYFTINQIFKIFINENKVTLGKQLSRLTISGKILRIKRGLYIFPDRDIDDLELAHLVYQPSYVSLETALNIYGIIPDIPAQITSITTITPNTYHTSRGSFSYSSIKKDLYFGFNTIENHTNHCVYQLAEPEKAVLDWIYIRRINSLDELRWDLHTLDHKKIGAYIQYYPSWVRKTLHL